MTARIVGPNRRTVKHLKSDETGLEILKRTRSSHIPFGTAQERGVGEHGIFCLTEVAAVPTPFGRSAAIVLNDKYYMCVTPRLKTLLRIALGDDPSEWVGQKLQIAVEETLGPGRYRHRYVLTAPGANHPRSSARTLPCPF